MGFTFRRCPGVSGSRSLYMFAENRTLDVYNVGVSSLLFHRRQSFLLPLYICWNWWGSRCPQHWYPVCCVLHWVEGHFIVYRLMNAMRGLYSCSSFVHYGEMHRILQRMCCFFWLLFFFLQENRAHCVCERRGWAIFFYPCGRMLTGNLSHSIVHYLTY